MTLRSPWVRFVCSEALSRLSPKALPVTPKGHLKRIQGTVLY